MRRCNPTWLDGTLGAVLLAAAVLGLADAASALWSSRGVAPAATIPLCLTAPFVLALVVLLPATPVVALVWRARGDADAGRAAALLGVAAALAVLRGADVLRAAWRDAGAASLASWSLLPVAAVALAVAVVAARFAARVLRRAGDSVRRRLVVVAAVVQIVALAGVAWQWRREGRGLERDLLSAAWTSPSEAAERPPYAAVKSSSTHASATPADHLVLVTIDTLRADHLNPRHMPHASALANQGARFTAAFAASSWTLPAMASLMTGLPASRHGAGVATGVDPLARSPLPEGVATIATVLRDAGFATRAIVTNPYLGLGYGLGAGFASFENVTMESEAVLTLRPTVGFWIATRLIPSLAISDRGDAVTSRAARFLAQPPPGRFFLWLHYVDPHAPYDGVTRSFRDDLLAGSGGGALPRMAQLRAGEIRPDAEGRARLRAAYARAVRAVDEQLGAVLALLERHRLASRTLIVVTADHGEELWDHGGVEHGHTLYDELVRVPLVMRCPSCVPAAHEIATPVGIVALAPTVLELLGVAPNERAVPHLTPDAGFARALRGEPFVPSPVVSENLLFAEDRVALRTAHHTYVVWPHGKEELYDRARDPTEQRDLAARRGLVRRHRALLAATRDAPRPADGAHGNGAGTAVDGRTRRALAALGYVE